MVPVRKCCKANRLAPLTSSPIFSKSATSSCSRTIVVRNSCPIPESIISRTLSLIAARSIGRAAISTYFSNGPLTSMAMKSIVPSSTMPRTISGCVPLVSSLTSKPRLLIIRHNTGKSSLTVGSPPEITTPSNLPTRDFRNIIASSTGMLGANRSGNTSSGLWQ